MHFHLPKPLHGWREFAGEVGIIVLGVLIALSAEQLVGWLRDRQTVHQIRSAMMSELAEDRTRVEWLQAQDKCVSSRLDEMSAWAENAAVGAHLDEPQRPRLWSVHSNAWELAKTSQAAEHIPLKERLTAASLYDSMSRLERFLVDEDHDWKLINSLVNAPVTPEGRVELSRAIAAARYDVMRRETSLSSLYRRFDGLSVRADPAVRESLGSPDQLCTVRPMSASTSTE